MSRIGKIPIPVPEKTKIEIVGKLITITGPKGTLSREIHADMTVENKDNTLFVTRPSDQKKHRALHGLTRSLVNNMVIGVTAGFKRELEVIGVGYRSMMKSEHVLQMNLGYSHPIIFGLPEGIKVTIPEKSNRVVIEGIDKELVGAVAAKIRSFRKPEPFKGKGVRYLGEHVRSKPGKAAATSAA